MIDQSPDGALKEKIADLNECQHLVNESCCNDYPAEEYCRKCKYFTKEQVQMSVSKNEFLKIRLTAETKDYADQAAYDEGISVSEYIRRLIINDAVENNVFLDED